MFFGRGQDPAGRPSTAVREDGGASELRGLPFLSSRVSRETSFDHFAVDQ